MAAQGATIQKFNNELVKCLEDLKEKRDALNRAISKEEEMKHDVTKKLHKLTEQLHKLNESLAAKVQARTDYDTTISEAEAAYGKIVASSQTLLQVLQREASQLSAKKMPSLATSVTTPQHKTNGNTTSAGANANTSTYAAAAAQPIRQPQQQPAAYEHSAPATSGFDAGSGDDPADD